MNHTSHEWYNVLLYYIDGRRFKSKNAVNGCSDIYIEREGEREYLYYTYAERGRERIFILHLCSFYVVPMHSHPTLAHSPPDWLLPELGASQPG
jgi:hypothetical protein